MPRDILTERHLLATFDSSAILPDRPADGARSFLTARIEALVRILLRQKLYIPEGWSIDSLAFLRTATEILAAAAANPEAGRKFVAERPIVAEVRQTGETHYRKIMRYLGRDVVSWGGLPGFRDEARRRDLLDSMTRIVASRGEDADARHFEAALDRAIGDANHVHWLITTSNYLKQKDTSLLNRPAAQFQFDAFRADLAAIDRLEEVRADHVWQSSLRGIRRRIDEEEADFSSSNLIEIVETESGLDLSSFLRTVIKKNYMQMCLTREARAHSSPILQEGSSAETRRLVEAFNGARAEIALERVEHSYLTRLDARLVERLDGLLTSEWQAIWIDAISLVTRADWRDAVAAFKREVGEAGMAVDGSAAFGTMQELLARRCRQLSLTSSGLRSIGLSISPRWEKTIEKGISQAVGLAAGRLVPEPLVAIVTFLHTLLMPEGKTWNPASDQFVLGRRTSVLDAVR